MRREGTGRGSVDCALWVQVSLGLQGRPRRSKGRNMKAGTSRRTDRSTLMVVLTPSSSTHGALVTFSQQLLHCNSSAARHRSSARFLDTPAAPESYEAVVEEVQDHPRPTVRGDPHTTTPRSLHSYDQSPDHRLNRVSWVISRQRLRDSAKPPPCPAQAAERSMRPAGFGIPPADDHAEPSKQARRSHVHLAAIGPRALS